MINEPINKMRTQAERCRLIGLYFYLLAYEWTIKMKYYLTWLHVARC